MLQTRNRTFVLITESFATVHAFADSSGASSTTWILGGKLAPFESVLRFDSSARRRASFLEVWG